MTFPVPRRLRTAVCLALLASVTHLAGAVAQTGGGGGGQDEQGPGGSRVFDDSDNNVGTPKPGQRQPEERTRPGQRAPDPDAGNSNGTEAPQEQTDPPATAPPPAKPVVVPDKAAQDKALKLVRDVFAEEYRKKSAADKLALAAQLLEQAADAGNDDATRYVMLREARDIAAAGGDVDTAMAAVDEMAGRFQKIDAVSLKLEALAASSKKVADAAHGEALVTGFLTVSAQALAGGDLERATKIVAQAEPVARKAKNAGLTARLNQRKKELKELQAQFGAPVAQARAKLKTNPDDPAANAVLGKFYCLAAGNWPTGLAMLAKGNDQALRKVAQDDLAGTDGDAAAKAALGDTWWEFGEKQSGLPKQHARARAAHWYEQAADGLEGLNRTRV